MYSLFYLRLLKAITLISITCFAFSEYAHVYFYINVKINKIIALRNTILFSYPMNLLL